MPGVEGAIRLPAEHAGPAAGWLVERARESRGHRAVEQRLRRRAMVARVAIAADLIFRLNHDDGILRIMIAHIGHQLDKCALVRRQRRFAMVGEHIMVLALLGLHAGKAAIVELHPVGRVGKAGILPRAKPQEDDALCLLYTSPSPRDS